MKLKIVGIGGAGRNMINALLDDGLEPEIAVYLDTDINAVPAYKGENFVRLGERGIGTGSNPLIGLEAATLYKERIIEMIGQADMIVIIAGLAGGLGGGAINFIVDLLLNTGVTKVVAYVTTPAEIEGAKRKMQANSALANLRQVMDKENIHVIATVKSNPARMYELTDKLVVNEVMKLLKKRR